MPSCSVRTAVNPQSEREGQVRERALSRHERGVRRRRSGRLFRLREDRPAGHAEFVRTRLFLLRLFSLAPFCVLVSHNLILHQNPPFARPCVDSRSAGGRTMAGSRKTAPDSIGGRVTHEDFIRTRGRHGHVGACGAQRRSRGATTGSFGGRSHASPMRRNQRRKPWRRKPS